MAESTVQGARFQRADLPRAYDAVLVPRVFNPWARELLSLVNPQSGEAALDVACGPGTVTRQLAALVGLGGAVTGADLSEPMLEVARSKPTTGEMAPITWVKSPAAPLNVASETFDVATCQHGLQFFPDRAAALAEIHRALKPGGRVAIAVWGGSGRGAFPTANLRERLTEHLGEAGASSTGFAQTPGDLRAALEEAGFRGVQEGVHTLEIDWTDPDTVVQALAATPFQELLAQLSDQQRSAVLAELRVDLEGQMRGGRLVHHSSAVLAVGNK